MQRYHRQNKLRVTDFVPIVPPRPKQSPPDFTELHRAQALHHLQLASKERSGPTDIEPWRIELCRALIDVLDEIDPMDCVHIMVSTVGSPPGGWREYDGEAARAVMGFEENGSDTLLAQLIATAIEWGFGNPTFMKFNEMPLIPTKDPFDLLAAQQALNRSRSYQGLPRLKFNLDAIHLVRAELGLPYVKNLPEDYSLEIGRSKVILLGVQ